jgi:hypothetical protein
MGTEESYDFATQGSNDDLGLKLPIPSRLPPLR